MSSNPAIQFDFIKPADHAGIAAIEAARKLEPWDENALARTLTNVSNIGIKAMIGGKLAGYTVYQRDNQCHQNSILKFVVAPAFAEHRQAIQEQMLGVVREDMVTQGRSKMVVYTTAQDQETLDFFASQHQEFKRQNAQGVDQVMLIYEVPHLAQNAGQATDSNNLPPGLYSQSFFVGIPPMDGLNITPPPSGLNVPGMEYGSTFIPPYMEADGYGGYSIASQYTPNSDNESANDFSVSSPDEDLPALPKAKPLSPAARIIRAREKLTELTGMEWETVTLGKRGKFQDIDLTPATHITDEIYLRTASKVADPKKALAALYTYLGEQPPRLHSAQLDKAVPIVIASSMIRPIHLALGEPEQLAGAFKPASTQMRYAPNEDVIEPKRQLRR